MRNLMLGLLALLAIHTATAVAGTDLVPWTGGPTAALNLKDLGGKNVNLADYRGKVVVVNFWATWCAPCIAEMPSMQTLRDKLGSTKFDVLAVNYQEGTPRINDFLKKRPLTLTILRDADGAARTAWGVKVFPTSFVVDAEGRIRYTVQGDVEWLSPKVESQIRELLPKA
jgi:thiol-disulfide isomerase/thioredoxin